MENRQIEMIKNKIESIRQEIINHRVYSLIDDLDDLKIFMQFHVYAVWDFMSLLKTLQNNLTCTSVPWFPAGSADTRFLINEIVVGEESDIDSEGNRVSHFELYIKAMKQCGADCTSIESFIQNLRKTGDLESSFHKSKTPFEAKKFVDFTFSVINSKKVHLQSAIFTFGREDLIPGMFISLINKLNVLFPNQVSIFKYYVERHIEIDGDHHSQLALKMTSNLCEDKNDYWFEAESAIIESLKRRIQLWDGVATQLLSRKIPK